MVCGCFSQVAPEQAAAIEGVDVVIGTRNRPDVVYYVNQFLKTGQPVVDVERVSDIGSERITDFSDKTRAIIKIEDGCRNFCSYCLIPFARGVIVSKPLSQVVSEAEAVAARGYREAVLTGIHLSSYGKDLDGVRLEDAIEAVAAVDGIERIRLGSLEPTVVTERFAERLSGVRELCPSFHLSLQSGCDRTLKAMNRHYTAGEYARAVEILRGAFDNCAITTDIIVGFPGETEEDFAESAEFARRIGFAKIHIFPYSRRRGTRADKMDGQIAGAVKQRREKALSQVEAESRGAFIATQVGKTASVLVERCTDGTCTGFTENYLHAQMPGCEDLCGKTVPVKVTGFTDGILDCEII